MSDLNELPGPCSVRQEMYMFPEKYTKDAFGNPINVHVDVTLYGGAAGSGKSEIGVIDFLKWTDTPGFIGVMTRRTTPQLTGPGGLLEKCKRTFSKAYSPDEFIYRAKDNKFVFKSGAQIYLKHFENDQADVNWQGAEANLFYVDEGTQFTQHMIQYIMSRMRNPSCPQVKPHLKITCNPKEDHFLRKWVEPYLLEDGTPDRTKDGMVRYFSFKDGDFVWADTVEELVSKHGVEEQDALSFTFISATVLDNPIVQKVNPKYVSWLKGLRGVERAQLLDGNWYARDQGATYFDRSWVEEIIDFSEDEVERTVRAFDFAGTLKSELLRSPDYTATVRMRRMKDGRYLIDDVRRIRIRAGEWQRFVLDCAKDDPPMTDYYIPLDPGPAAKRAMELFARDLSEEGLYVKKLSTNQKKLDRFRPFSSMAQNGGVIILKNCATDLENNIRNDNSFFYRELESFTGERNRSEGGHDDKPMCRH